MIEAKGLTKVFGTRTAIADVTFQAEKGEILGFLGPNGAGKTTTMRILTCLLPATSGTARVSGFDVFDHPIEVKRQIGYLPESPPLYYELTVVEYLRFVGRIKGLWGKRLTASLENALDRCSIGDVRHRLVGNLSRGYKQRVGLAQALIHNPPILILDEPTVGLDPKQIIEMRHLIKEMGGEKTIILSTHILPEVTAVCHRVIIISDGRVVAVDTPERLSATLRRSEKISLTVKGPTPDAPDRLKEIPGVLDVFHEGDGVFVVESQLGRDCREEIARCAVQSGWGLLEMKPITLTLEDVFVRLTTSEKEEQG